MIKSSVSGVTGELGMIYFNTLGISIEQMKKTMKNSGQDNLHPPQIQNFTPKIQTRREFYITTNDTFNTPETLYIIF
jgi:hypothetical protein